MHSARKSVRLFGFVVLCLIGAVASRPALASPTDFTFTLSNPDIVAAPGSSVTYDGTVTFTAAPVTVPSGVVVIFSNHITDLTSFDFDPSLKNFLFGTVVPGSSYTGALFDVSLAPSASLGDIPVLPNSNITLTDSSGSVNHLISLTVSNGSLNTPEPSSLAALGLGGLALIAFGVRSRKTSAAKI